MHILVLTDDRYHPARTPRAGLQPFSGEYEFEWIENAADWSASRMSEFPLTILTKSNSVSAADDTPWVTPEVERAFAAYVRSGKGLLAIHSGTAGYAQTPLLRSLLGGVFDHHPEQCLVEIAPVMGEPLASDLAPFTIRDEHYFMAMDDHEAQVFLTSASENGAQSAGWTRREGQGRVCVLTPGHNLEVWLHPTYQKIIRTAIRWCSDIQKQVPT
jgi:type 1 glutamine amidotransferase